MFNFLKRLKKNPEVRVNDIGIYKDTVVLDTINDSNRTIKYEFYAKVKAVSVFEDLVEVEIVRISTSNSCSQDIINIVMDNIPQFLDPKLIKWEIKQEIMKEEN